MSDTSGLAGYQNPTDYRALLVKYMRHVYEAEGSTFVSRLNYYDGPRFTGSEAAALQRIEREALAPPPPTGEP